MPGELVSVNTSSVTFWNLDAIREFGKFCM